MGMVLYNTDSVMLTAYFSATFSHSTVAARLQEGLGIQPLMFATSWFMCLFTGLHCWDTVLLISDLLFLEGILSCFVWSCAAAGPPCVCVCR